MKTDDGREKRKESLLSRVISSLHFMLSDTLSTRDQRQAARITCDLAVTFVDEFGTRGEGAIIDVSKNGLQLLTPKKLRRGVTLAVRAPDDESLDRTAPFMAKTRWCRKAENGKFRVGLLLPPGVENDPHWLESLLHQLGYTEDGGQRREYIRAETQISGRITPVDEQNRVADDFEVSVLNLGMGGALLKSQIPLSKNGQFHLSIGPYEDLPELRLFGTILRVVEKPDHILYPSRFRAKEEHEEKVLEEYILKLSGMDD